MRRGIIIAVYIAGALAVCGCGSDVTKSWDGTWVSGDEGRHVTIELSKENGMYLMRIGGGEPGGFTYDSESEIFYAVIDNDKYTVTFKGRDNFRFESPHKYIDFTRK